MQPVDAELEVAVPPLRRAPAGDPHRRGHMRDRGARLDPPTQQQSTLRGQRSVTVTHEDLRGGVLASTPAHLQPEVFAWWTPTASPTSVRGTTSALAARRPVDVRTVWFVGVSTAGSLVHRAMPRWRPLLDDDVTVRGRDLPLNVPAGAYRSLLDDLRRDGAARGAVVTSHKVALYRSASDLFAGLDDLCVRRPARSMPCAARLADSSASPATRSRWGGCRSHLASWHRRRGRVPRRGHGRRPARPPPAGVRPLRLVFADRRLEACHHGLCRLRRHDAGSVTDPGRPGRQRRAGHAGRQRHRSGQGPTRHPPAVRPVLPGAVCGS